MFPNPKLSHTLVYMPKCYVFNYLADANHLTKLYFSKAWCILIVLKVPWNRSQSVSFAVSCTGAVFCNIIFLLWFTSVMFHLV